MIRLISAAALSLCVAAPVFAETYDVKMLNRGEAGTMVFEPDHLQIASGDTVRFVPTDKGHNAETIPDMLPEGAEEFKGKMNQEIEVVFDTEGLYGIRCKPHFAMGMVMTVAVGDDVEAGDDFFPKRLPKKAKSRIEEQLAALAEPAEEAPAAD